MQWLKTFNFLLDQAVNYFNKFAVFWDNFETISWVKEINLVQFQNIVPENLSLWVAPSPSLGPKISLFLTIKQHMRRQQCQWDTDGR